MSILIKGAKLPKNCWECFSDELNVGIACCGAKCPFCERIITRDEFNAWTGRHPDCPLVEVKEPHGRLIDEDEYQKKICTYNETGCGSCEYQTKCPADAPTVIEAEGEE